MEHAAANPQRGWLIRDWKEGACMEDSRAQLSAATAGMDWPAT